MKSLLLASLLMMTSNAFSQTILPRSEGEVVLKAIDIALRNSSLNCVSILGDWKPDPRQLSFSNLYETNSDVTVTLSNEQPIVIIDATHRAPNAYTYSFTTNEEETEITKIEFQQGIVSTVQVNTGTIRHPKFETRKEMKVQYSAVCE